MHHAVFEGHAHDLGWVAGGRTPEGWKGGDSDPDWDDYVEEPTDPGSHPSSVKAIPRLTTDIESLLRLMQPAQPPLRLVRSRRLAVAIYGFGDASGAGFGSSFVAPGGRPPFPTRLLGV